MATALVDKLHLAFEQVKKKNNLGVQFSWQSISLNSAKEHSTAAAGATQTCLLYLYHPRQKMVQIQDSTWLRFVDLHGSPLPQNCFHFPTSPESGEGPCSTSTVHRQHTKPFLHPLPCPTQSKAMVIRFFPSFLHSLKAIPPETCMELQPKLLH